MLYSFLIVDLSRDLLLTRREILLKKVDLFCKKVDVLLQKVDRLAQNSGPFICEGGSSEPTKPLVMGVLYVIH